jgi:hypothetical protein
MRSLAIVTSSLPVLLVMSTVPVTAMGEALLPGPPITRDGRPPATLTAITRLKGPFDQRVSSIRGSDATGPSASTSGRLFGLACTSPQICIAVGTSSKTTQVLSERWDGSKWAVDSTPTPNGASFASLEDVSCAAPRQCIAVGQYIGNDDKSQYPLAESWNGSGWIIQATPYMAYSALFDGVSCITSTSCIAVGSYASNSAGTQDTLAERWNGRAWYIQKTPNPAGGGWLTNVACVSVTYCVAVGFGGDVAGTLIEHWNGSKWAIALSSPRRVTALAGVACTSESACLAVGVRRGSPSSALAESWNGTSWTPLMPVEPKGGGELAGVACASGRSCTAVGGSYSSTARTAHTLAERWNGKTWSMEQTPNPKGRVLDFLYDVACVPSMCMAVGSDENVAGNWFTLAEGWNGHAWAIEPTA